MTAILKILDAVPSWVWALVCAALLATSIAAKMESLHFERVAANAKVTVATLTADIAKARADAVTDAANAAATHAKTQQEITDAFNTKLRDAQTDRDAARALVGRLRAQLADFTRPGSAPAQPAPAGNCQDRLAALGGLLDEGIVLVDEGRARLERRDAEVAALVAQVRADRAACSP